MKKLSIRFVKWLLSLVAPAKRRHDPLLVFNMAWFNYGGAWRNLVLKASPQNT
jgi:hypothetical protein